MSTVTPGANSTEVCHALFIGVLGQVLRSCVTLVQSSGAVTAIARVNLTLRDDQLFIAQHASLCWLAINSLSGICYARQVIAKR